MNHKKARLVVGAIALVMGSAAVIGMKSIMTKPAVVVKTKKVNTVNVLVARRDIGLGDVVKESSFRWLAWPRDALGPKYIRQDRRASASKELAGSIARSQIMAGEPISSHKLIKVGEGGVLASILPSGMRAISTKISEQSAAGQLILPNDHVDVILTRRLRGRNGNNEHVVDTLFRNVRVLAIGQVIEAKEGKKSVEAKTATLELTPLQAELLVQANAMGTISLALRSVADFGLGKGPKASMDLKSQRGNSISVLRYGVKSRAYGVN